MQNQFIKRNFIQLRSYFTTNKFLIWIFALLGFIIFTNQIHASYPDEFENILGGHYILSGRFPYVGFFSQHNPGAFFLSAVINLISGASFVKFRILLGVCFLLAYIGFYKFISNKFTRQESNIILIFYFFITFGATFFWGNMLLADSLSAYLLAPAYILCIFYTLKNKSIGLETLSLISILTFSTVLTTMTQVYACSLVYLLLLILNFKNKTVPWLKFFTVILLPYVIFAIYLAITGSIVEYYRQSIDFNTSYYVHLPDGASFKSPLRVAVVFLDKFFINFRAALLFAKDFNFGSPFVPTLALSNAVLLLFLAIKRKFSLLTWIVIFLAFINARGNPYSTAETDYQSIVYHFISIFNGILVIYLLKSEIEKIHSESLTTNLNTLLSSKNIIFNILLIALSIYQLSLFAFFFDRWLDKSYSKFMGIQSTIYDNPPIATVLNKLTNKNDYYYIAPFDFEDQLYMKSKLASKYIVVLPGMDNSPRMQNDILGDITRNHPKVIVYNTEKNIYGNYPGKFLLNYIRQEYTNLEDIGMVCSGYQSKQKWFGDYDFERHFFFDKKDKDQIINTLLDDNLIYKTDSGVIKSIPHCNSPK